METAHRTQHLIKHGLKSLVSPLMQILRLVKNKTNKQNPLVNTSKLWCSHKIINKITRELWVIFSTLPLKIMTKSRIYREEGRTGVMILLPSSNSWLNNASLASSYLSFMFCAFPKSLSKRSGLGLRVTSNDNLFAVICVYKQPKTFRTPIQHFLKTNKSFKKLSYLKQLFLSKNRGNIPKRRAPSLPHNSTCRTGDWCFHSGRMVWSKDTYPEPSSSRTLQHCIQVIQTRWSMQMNWPKSSRVQTRLGSQTSSEWFGVTRNEGPMKWLAFRSTLFKYISLKIRLYISKYTGQYLALLVTVLRKGIGAIHIE